MRNEGSWRLGLTKGYLYSILKTVLGTAATLVVVRNPI